MYWAQYKNIYFVEGAMPAARAIRGIDTKHDGWFPQSQLKSLDTIKDIMVQEVLSAHGNAVIGFRYGQKNTFWRSLMSIDDVYWWATGTIAAINPADLPSRSP